ncbi:hypothetical protein BD309DRAFT_989391 [Dichomitus squalens]|uniref:Uncharacterized protein n=1 Tax=Dichomitus squalens TaxID=114155 RepID=A0A4Q9NX57_9APHY|nr:hypothetical protein BD309DRAFT_989391 [Dichomitus squalens]TBU59928.1 hypothetical protein BD310DRAFT_947686 [Dichomitus squalens]
MVPKSTVLSQLAPRALHSQRRQCDPFIGLSKHHPIASLHPPFVPNAGSVNTSSGDAIEPHRKGAPSTQTLHIAQSSTGLGA